MKKSFKTLALMLFVILSAAVIVISSSAAAIPGDVNGDGEVNIRDAAAILQFVTGHDVELVAPCTHSGYVVIDPAVDPTYDKSGLTIGVSCTKCGEKLIEQETVPALGHEHTEAVIPAVPATCQEEGLTEGKYCTKCNAVLVKQQSVPKVDHELGDWEAYGSYTVRRCIKSEDCDVSIRVTSISATYNGSRLLTGEQVWKNDVTVTVTLSDNTSFTAKSSQFTLENDVMTVDGNNVVTVKFVNTATTVTVPAIHDNLPGTASASDFEYSGADKDAITITKYIGTSANVVIPAHINRVPVRYIGDSAFSGNKVIQSVTIPGSIWSIGQSAFYNCTGLKTLALNEGLNTIKGQAFMNSSITELIIPDSVTTINVKNPDYSNSDGAFEGCTKLKTIVIGSGVSAIPKETFSGCTSLTNLTIGDSVQTIGAKAFYGCISLPSLVITNGVQLIDDNAFDNCTALSEIAFGSELRTIDARAFQNCASLKAVNIPGNVQTIGEEAFRGCSELTALTLNEGLITIKGAAFYSCPIKELIIPDSVVTIGTKNPDYSNSDGAFEGCKKLETIVIGDGLAVITKETFNGCTALNNLTIGNGVETIGNKAFYGCSSLTTLVISDSVQVINESAFENCSALSSITFGKGVHTIHAYAFQNCTSLTSVNIPGNVQSIRTAAFYGCSGLTSLKLNEGLKEINGMAFAGCPITELIIPNSVTAINTRNPDYSNSDGAFENCKMLKTIVIGDGLAVITKETFSGCTALNNLTIGNGVETIGNKAFYGCTSLTTLVISDSVQVINESAFENCSALSSITFGKGVHTIHAYAFQNCTSLTSVNIPGNVQSIRTAAFYGCSGLTSLKLNEGLKEINGMAFAGCPITELIIPNSVTAINTRNPDYSNSDGAFENCKMLKTIVIGDGLAVITKETFSGCTALNNLTIGNGVETIGNKAFYGCTSLTTLVIGDSVQVINESAFENCSALSSITFGKGVHTIHAHAFQNCTSLTSVNIPGNVQSIRTGAFYGCSSLSTLKLNEGLKEINGIAFAECPITELIIPNSVTAINTRNPDYSNSDGAFENCKMLKTVVIGNGLSNITKETFNGCSSLVNVTIGTGVITISNLAFGNCTSLVTINIPDNVQTIGSNAFKGCTLLENFRLGTGVQSIGASALQDCTSIDTVTIPANVQSIGNSAFQGCIELDETIIENGNLQTLGSNVFKGCSSFDRIYYCGTADDWSVITVNATNVYPLTESPYYYSATSPSAIGNYWYYDTNGTIRVWNISETSFKAEEYSEKFAYSEFGSEETSYSTQLLKDLKSDTLLQAGIAIWEGLNTITDFDSKKITKKEVYKLVIYDLLMGEVNSNVNPLACLEEACGSYMFEYASFLLETDPKDLEALKYVDPSLYNNADFFNKFFKGIEGAEQVFKTSANLYDALYTCAQYQALSDMDTNFYLVLTEISKNTSLPTDLRNAAKDCANCYRNASAEMLAMVFANEFAAATMEDLWLEYAEVAWEAVITSVFPYYKVVELGVKGVMFLANAGFNLDARNEAYYQLEAAVGLENALRKVIKDTMPDYFRYTLKDKSEYYMYAIEMYQTSVVLGFDYSCALLTEFSKGLDVNASEKQAYDATISQLKDMKNSKKQTYNNFDQQINQLFVEYYAY